MDERQSGYIKRPNPMLQQRQIQSRIPPVQVSNPVNSPNIKSNTSTIGNLDRFIGDVKNPVTMSEDYAIIASDYQRQLRQMRGLPIYHGSENLSSSGHQSQQRQELRRIGNTRQSQLPDQTKLYFSTLPTQTRKIVSVSQIYSEYGGEFISEKKIPSAISQTGFHEMWSKYKGEDQVTITITGGVDARHRDIRNSMIQQNFFVPDPSKNCKMSTAAVGLICARGNFYGTAPASKFIDLVVVNKSGAISDEAITSAFKWILNYIREGKKLSCVFFPFKCNEENHIIDQYIRKIQANGITVIGPLGLSVGAYDYKQKIPCYNMNRNLTLDIYLPGADCFSCVSICESTNTELYSVTTGASYACGILCGIVCLLTQKLQDEGVSRDIREKIENLLVDVHTKKEGKEHKDYIVRYNPEKDKKSFDKSPEVLHDPKPSQSIDSSLHFDLDVDETVESRYVEYDDDDDDIIMKKKESQPVKSVPVRTPPVIVGNLVNEETPKRKTLRERVDSKKEKPEETSNEDEDSELTDLIDSM